MICAKEHFLSQLHFKLNFDLCWELIFAMILKKIINCCREKPNNIFVFYVWKSNFSGLIQASSVSILIHLEEIIGYPRCCKLMFSLGAVWIGQVSTSPSIPLQFFVWLPPFSFLLYLASFFLSFSSSSSFWADVRLSASARLSTAMAKKTFSRISVQRGDVKDVADPSDHKQSWL